MSDGRSDVSGCGRLDDSSGRGSNIAVEVSVSPRPSGSELVPFGRSPSGHPGQVDFSWYLIGKAPPKVSGPSSHLSCSAANSGRRRTDGIAVVVKISIVML